MMKKHNFKVGDKVKVTTLCLQKWPIYEGIKSEVSGYDGQYIIVKFISDCDRGVLISKGYADKNSTFPFLPEEIEPVLQVGEQLLFNFMKGD